MHFCGFESHCSRFLTHSAMQHCKLSVSRTHACPKHIYVYAVGAEIFQGCNITKIKGWTQTVKRELVRRRSASFALRLCDNLTRIPLALVRWISYLFHYKIPLDKGCISCRFAPLRCFPGGSVSVALPSAHCTHLRPGEQASPGCVLRALLPEADCSPRFLTVSCSVGGATPTSPHSAFNTATQSPPPPNAPPFHP